jgi:hypothetical protein
MAVYSKESKHSAQQVIDKAVKFFTSKPLHLKSQEIKDGCPCASFEGGGGFVNVTASDKGKGSEVNLETREWDYWVQHFLEEI